MSKHLNHSKLLNFLENEDLECDALLNEDTWEEMNEKLVKLENFFNEDKLEEEFSRLLKQRMRKIVIFNHKKKL